MEESIIIHLVWKEYKWDKNVFSNFNTKDDIGIYQIYGDHPIYGKNVLLYIGKTSEQNFSTRMKGHGDFYATQISKIRSINLSYLVDNNDVSKKNWCDYIGIVEKLLINSHFPAYNSQNIKGLIDDEVKNTIILNWGERGDLLPEVSTLRYTSKFWNFSDLLKKQEELEVK